MPRTSTSRRDFQGICPSRLLTSLGRSRALSFISHRRRANVLEPEPRPDILCPVAGGTDKEGRMPMVGDRRTNYQSYFLRSADN
jgi:hypothetical protein